MFNRLFSQARKLERALSCRVESDCLLCHESVSSTQTTSLLLCLDCHARLPFLSDHHRHCPICAMPIPQATTEACGACLQESPAFQRTVAAFHYEAPVKEFVTQLKFNARRHFAPLLAGELASAVRRRYTQAELPSALVPVPLHPNKIRARGFNQAQLLANSLSGALAIEVLGRQVERHRNTQAQTALNAKQRKKNLRGAFTASGSFPEHLAVVDDVMTTGTTANELAGELLKQGARRVDVWCAARAYSI